MHSYRVLVIGGYGFFGSRLVGLLGAQSGLHVLVAGRDAQAAASLVLRLQSRAAASLEACALDILAPTLAADLRTLQPAVVVHTAGPFQGQDYRVAEACIAAGVHYIDLADGRAFVAGIGVLAERAARAGVAVVSGASSVPALSGAVADALAVGMVQVQAIDIGISPGNRTERGLSTVRAVLGYCGQRLPVEGGEVVFGWSGSWAQHYPAPVGARLLSPCDVPDLVLLPLRYPGRPRVRFGAGLELRWMHRGMNAMAWVARHGIVADWGRFAVPLKRVADLFLHQGSDVGAMHVQVTGTDAQGRSVQRRWRLLARAGHGPSVPVLAAAALVRRLAEGGQLPPGAAPCVGMLTLEDLRREAQGLQIEMEKLD